MDTVQASELRAGSLRDVQVLVRQLRVVTTNARIYAQGHAQRAVASEALWDLLLELNEALGELLIEVVDGGLLLNGTASPGAEKGGVIVSQWLQKRAVHNILFDGRGRLDELEGQLDLLIELDAASTVRLRKGQEVGMLATPPLVVNVSVDAASENAPVGTISRQVTAVSALSPGDARSPAEAAEPLETTDDAEPSEASEASEPAEPAEPAEAAEPAEPAEPAEAAEPAEPAEAAEPAEPAEAAEPAEPAEADASGPAAAADTEEFAVPEPELLPVAWAELDVSALDAAFDSRCASLLAASSVATGGGAGIAGALASVIESLEGRGAAAVTEYLAVPLPTGQAGLRLRRALLVSLQSNEELRAEVLGTLARRVGEEADEALGCSLIQACEELVSAAIDSGELHTVEAFVRSLGSASGRGGLLDERAESARIYLSSPALVEKMVHKMEVLPRDQCELIRSILRGFGSSTMLQLFELMMAATRRSVRLSLVDVMVHHLKGAVAAGEQVDALFEPLLKELERADQNPWYVTRNLVFILSQVNTPTCQRALLRLASEDHDSRVLAELARGLVQTDSESARDLLAKLAFAPTFIDAGGLFDLVRHLYRYSPVRIRRGVEERLSGADVLASVAEGMLLGMARSGGEEAVPFLSKLVSERAGLLKRPVFAEVVRMAALEAMATIRGKAGREALELGRSDKVGEVRRRAVELMHMEPSRAAAAAYGRLGVSPDADVT